MGDYDMSRPYLSLAHADHRRWDVTLAGRHQESLVAGGCCGVTDLG